jgi:CheY-like chemotaxis protein
LIGDDQLLAQVMTNLLGNAVKFTPEKGLVRLNVSLIAAANKPSPGAAGGGKPGAAGTAGGGRCTIRVEVADTGIGISEEQRARLFTSFGQAESSTARTYGGTGLGLAISKRIVEMMDGTIGVDSELGVGSTFWFTVTLERGTDGADGARSTLGADGLGGEKGASGGVADDDFTGRRALLVEDVEVNREIVCALLEPTHLEIESAENGVEALNIFAKDPDRYDLIFMDVQMPKMNGLEATYTIRAMDAPRAKTIPIIAMTASVFREDIEKCLAAGMNDHIGKPIDFTELIKKLHCYLDRDTTNT